VTLVAEAVVLRTDQALILGRMRVVAGAALQVHADRVVAGLGELVFDCRVAVVAERGLGLDE
jgi:hypothetical protein